MATTATALRNAQMNVRLNVGIKERGDAVLKRLGISPSEAVRALWGYLARTGEMPSCLMEDDDAAREAERQRKIALVREGVGLAARIVREQRVSTACMDDAYSDGDGGRALRDWMYEERANDYFRTIEAYRREREAAS